MPSKKRKKASSAAVVANKKRKVENKPLNPFEVRMNKKKHDVLGQRGKSDKGLPGISRSKAIQKRKKTLLQEYKQRNKSNQFVDRRFGEYDDEMSVEDKLLKRLVMERKRKHERPSRFNLADEEEGLTHYGQSIGDIDTFDEVQISEDETDEDIGETHFGGFLKKKKTTSEQSDEDEEKPKSRKQIMEEIVAKSKARKFERQSEKQEVENMLDKVDMDWKNVQGFLSKAKENEDERKGDDYDKIVRELVFERRGKPTDRLKSEEELAREEKERLEKLESDRICRMKGVSTEDEHTSADYIHERSTKKKQVRFALQYKDGQIVQPEGMDLNGENDKQERRVKVDSDDCNDESEEEEDESSEEPDDDDSEDLAEVYGSDLESGDEEECLPEQQKQNVSSPFQVEVAHLKDAASQELPYTFQVPRNLQEFRTIVEHRSPNECVTAVERIHACNHPSISPSNKQKLESFFTILIEYCTELAEKPNIRSLTILNKLARPLFALSQLNSIHAAGVCLQALSDAHQRWLERNRGLEYPPFSNLVLFKLIALIFPTSDYKHPVVTPAMLFMGQLLLKCKVKSIEHLLCGLFVCETMIEFVSQSKRFVPEIVNFLTSTIACFTKRKQRILYPPFSVRGPFQREPCGSGDTPDWKTDDDVPLLLLLMSKSGQSSEVSSWTRCATLRCTLELVVRVVELYKGLSSFLEVFSPVMTNLQCLDRKNWPPDLKELHSQASDLVASKRGAPRSFLQLLKQKPKSIKLYEPKFDQVYEVNRKKSRSKSTGEEQKLKYKVKKEKKGAIREIRKDAAFLAKEKLRETLEIDAERNRKTKKIFRDLQAMQHEEKMERRKKR